MRVRALSRSGVRRMALDSRDLRRERALRRRGSLQVQMRLPKLR